MKQDISPKNSEEFINDLIDKFINNYSEKKLKYLGISLIKQMQEDDLKNEDFFEVKFSLCCYDNCNYNINAFKNIIYKENINNDNNWQEISNFKYLRYFLNMKELPNKLYKKLYKIDEKHYIVFFISQEENDEDIQSFFEEITETIKNEDINILNNYEIEDINEKEEIVFIFDIKRPSFDKRKHFEKMNVIIDKFVITTIKDIAYENHFKAINHTGDGFIMIYQGKNLKVDFNNILKGLEKIKKDIFDFFGTLVDVYNEYRVRGILSKIKIYELKIDNSSHSNTIYMSSDLDGLFKKMKSMKKMEEEYFYALNNKEKKFFIIIDLKEKIQFTFDDILNIKICGI